MVLADPFQNTKSSKPSSGSSKKFGIAKPSDRFLAFILDCVICWLFFLPAILEPIKMLAFEADLYEQLSRRNSLIALAAILSIVFSFLYQALFLRFFSGTPGKLVMNLRVVDIHDQPQLEWHQCLLRALIMAFETLVAYIPNFAVFAQPQRRPFHDRLAETVVVSLKETDTGPTITERSFVKGMVFAAWCVLAIWVIIGSWQLFTTSASPLTMHSEGESEDCNVSHLQESAGLQNAAEAAVIQFVMGSLNSECLGWHAQQVLSEDAEEPVGYIAKALANETDYSVREKYLREACETSSASNVCGLAKLWFEAEYEDEGNLNISHDIDQVISKKSDRFLLLFASAVFYKIGNFRRAEELVREFLPNPILANFQAQLNIRFHHENGDDERAAQLLSVSLNQMSDEDKRNVLGWMCLRHIHQNCSQAKSFGFCKMLTTTSEPVGVDDELPEMAMWQWSRCEGKAKTFISHLPRTAGYKALHDIFLSGHLGEQSKMQGLLRLSAEKEIDSFVRWEAMFEALKTADSLDELKQLSRYWKQYAASTYEWREIGEGLANRFYQRGDKFSFAAVVANMEAQSYIPLTLGRLVIANLVRQGRMADAREYYNKLFGETRLPASSEDDWFEVERLLRRPKR